MIALAVILFLGAAYHLFNFVLTALYPDSSASRWDANIYLSMVGIEIVTGIGFWLLA